MQTEVKLPELTQNVSTVVTHLVNRAANRSWNVVASWVNIVDRNQSRIEECH